MLKKFEKDKILKLRSENFSYKAIREELGYAIDTIMDVCNEEKERKIKEVEKAQRSSKKAEENQTQGVYLNFNSPIDTLQKITTICDNIIKNDQLKAAEKTKLEKQIEPIREILEAEVDERIPADIANAVNERDDQWSDTIQRNYVKKETVEYLKNSIDAKDIQITELIGEINIKESILRAQQSEIHILKSEKTRLLNDNWRLNNDIQICHESGELKEGKLTLERQIFKDEAKKTNSNAETTNKKLIKDFNALCKEKEDVEKRKKNFTMREEEFDKKSENILNLMDNKQELILKGIDELGKITEKQRIERQRLHKWQKKLDNTGGFSKFSLKCSRCSQPLLFDVTDPETYQKITNIFGNHVHPECDINNMQPTYVKLRPVSFSGESVVRSGIPPIIKSGEEIEVFGPNGEPVA